MQYLWTGSYPQNRAPHIDSLLLDNKKASDFIYLQPDKDYIITVFAHDPNQNKMIERWELLPESTDLKNGGDREVPSGSYPGINS